MLFNLDDCSLTQTFLQIALPRYVYCPATPLNQPHIGPTCGMPLGTIYDLLHYILPCLPQLSPDAYLEHTLADLDLAGSDVKGIGEKNKMRGVIRDVFPSRSCMWLPHPGCNTKLMSTLPIDRMDPEFVEVGAHATESAHDSRNAGICV